MSGAVVARVLAGPIDFDLDNLFPDLVRLGLLLLGAVVALVVTAGLLLAGVTVGLTHLRRDRTPGRDHDEEDAPTDPI